MKRPLASWGRARAVAALVLAVGALAWTARAPEAGAGWRLVFVGAMLLAIPLALWAARRVQPGLRLTLAVALGLRLLALPLAPALSDDGYRYLWDGAIVASGESPYVETPRERDARGARGPVRLDNLNSPDYHSVYPPVSQAAFGFAAWVGGGSFARGWAAYKLLLVLAEMAALWALWGVVGRSLALWAWHPLVVIEFAGQGHTEGFALAFLGLALAAVARGREAGAGGWAALAGGVKLWPFGIGAVWGASRLRLLAALVVGGALALAPLAWGGGGPLASLGLYAGTFDFYSLPYLALKSALWPLAGDASGRIVSGVLGLAMLGVLGALAWRSRQRTVPPVRLAAAGVLAITLLSPTLHPWHLLPALWAVCVWPEGPLYRAVLWLTAVSAATYAVYVLDGPEALAALTAIGWGGAAALAWADGRQRLVESVLRRRGRAKWARIRPLVGEADRILDLGCGEGFVGAAAHADGHEAVLSDVVDARRVDLPFVAADEPLAPGSVDTTLLVFVLHHAVSPEAVLRRALDASGARVIVWETVPAPWLPKPLLQFIDQIANGLRVEPMRKANLRDVQEWETVFQALDVPYHLVSRWGRGHPQALWVLDAAGPVQMALPETLYPGRSS